MLASIKPIIDEPIKLPKRPDIIMNEVAMPRNLVGNKFTPTAIAIFAHEAKQMNSKNPMTVHLNSVKMFSVTHATIDIVNQMPKMKSDGKLRFAIFQSTF